MSAIQTDAVRSGPSGRILVTGAAGFAAIAVVALAAGTFDYLRDDGAVQKVATGSNVAFWAGLAVAGGLLARLKRWVLALSKEIASSSVSCELPRRTRCRARSRYCLIMSKHQIWK